MRVLFLILGTLVAAGVLILTLRIWGLNSPVVEYETEFFHWSPVAVVVPWSPTETFQHEPSTEMIVWVKVRQNAQHEIVAQSPRAKDHEDAEPLKNIFAKTAPLRLVLDVDDNTENLDLKISDAIPATEDQRVMIQSQYDVVLRAIKKLRPKMVFGSSAADETRLLVFDQLWLLPAAPFKGDVFWSSLSPHQGVNLTEAVVEELQRRKKKIFLGPLHSKEEVKRALAFRPDALIVDSVDLASHLKE